jgi:hypothetical protein
VHKVLLNRAVRGDRATSGDVKWRALSSAPSSALLLVSTLLVSTGSKSG